MILRLGHVVGSLFFLGVVSCTLILEDGVIQCETTVDCTNRGLDFANYVCSPDKVCAKSGDYCESNLQCVEANGGAPFLCKANKCTPGCADAADGSKPANQQCVEANGGKPFICKNEQCVVGCAASPTKPANQQCIEANEGKPFICKNDLCIPGCADSADGTKTGTQQCIEANGGQPYRCVNEQCVVGCDTNQQCITQANGAPAICVRPEHLCRTVLTNDCSEILAGVKGDAVEKKLEVIANDDVVLFGMVFDLRGSNKSRGEARKNAAELAVSEVHALSRGIPGGAGGKPRPIAIVACSEAPDATTPVDPVPPGKHLVDNLHVSAVIGANNSGSTINLLNTVTLPGKTVLFSPSATSAALSTIPDSDFYWRTASSDEFQGLAIRDLVPSVEAAVKAAQGLATVKIAILNKGDAYGKGLVTFALPQMLLNGTSLSNTAVNGTPCAASANCAGSKVYIREYSATASASERLAIGTDVAAFGPNIVLLLGTSEISEIVAEIEKQAAPPFYIGGESTRVASIGTLVLNSTNGLRQRVRGTDIKASAKVAAWTTFYNSQYPLGPAVTFGVPGSYDIGYLLTYAALAGSRPGEPLIGTDIIAGLKKVLSGAEANSIEVGTTDINKAFSLIQAGNAIKVKGISYVYDYDFARGEVPSDYDIWCPSQTATPILFNTTGLVYVPSTKSFSGSYVCPN